MRGIAALATRAFLPASQQAMLRMPNTGIATATQEKGLYFHSTARVELARPRLRRWAQPRRTSLEDNEEADDIKEGEKKKDAKPRGVRHEATTDPDVFKKAGSALIEKLYHALKPMEKHNDPFILTRGVEEDMGEFLLLDLGPVIGQYTVQVDLEQGIVVLQSPISGQMAYVLSRSNNKWVGKDDGHDLEGMLVRDLIKQCNGLPNL